MALMLSKTYDASLAAGTPQDKAREVAEEIAVYDNRFGRIETDLAVIKAGLSGVKWMLGFVIAGVVSVIVGVLSLVIKPSSKAASYRLGQGSAGSPLRQSGAFEFVEQCLRLFEIRGVEPLGEPVVYGREELAAICAAALLAAQPGKARSGAQLPELGFLLFGDAQRFAIQFLCGVGIPLPQQHLAFVPVQLRCKPALHCPFDDLQSLVQLGHGLLDFPCNLICRS
jgi:hypothetical protein